jgi:hypothetical protein
MKTLSKLLIAALTMGLIGCSSMRVSIDYDQQANFAKYKKFGWIKKKPNLPPRKHHRRSLVERQLKSAVERELLLKGYQKAIGDKPDLLIAFHIGAQDRVDVTHYGYRYGYRGHRWGTYTEVEKYKEGTLILDFVDPQLEELIWRGTAVGAIHYPETVGQKMEEAVEKMLKNFPPQ